MKDVINKFIKIPVENNISLHGMLIKKQDTKKANLILVYSPYPQSYVIDRWRALSLVQDDWIFLAVSTRGRQLSEGESFPFCDDKQDLQNVISWCKSQEWFDKNIFMLGASYEGWVQWQNSDNLELDGIVPNVSCSNLSDWFYENGAFRNAFAQSWGLSLVYTEDIFKHNKPSELSKYWTAHLLELYNLPLKESPLMKILKGYKDWIIENNSLFSKLHKQGNPKDKKIPVYICTGWNDIFFNGAMKDFKIKKEHSNDRLVIGPWSHDSIGNVINGDCDYGFGADFETFNVYQDQIDWMKSLKNNSDYDKKISYFIMGLNQWRHINNWPPQTNKKIINNKKSDLYFETITNKGVINLNPQNPPKAFGGKKHYPNLPTPGRKILTDWIQDENPIIIKTNKLQNDILITGEVTINLDIKASSLPFDIYCVVAEENKYGKITSILEGIYRSNNNGRIQFVISQTSYLLSQNSRLVLLLSGGAFPTFNNIYFDRDEKIDICVNLDKLVLEVNTENI